MENASIVRYVGTSSAGSCGYCKSTKVAKESFGLWAHRLSVAHYMGLLDRGWRRSGRYLYKPIMEKTCCPQYTIRLDIHKFRLSRTQKRVLRTMHDFLKHDKRPAKAVSEEDRPRRIKGDQNEEGKEKSTIYEPEKARTTSKQYEKKKLMRRRRAEERMKQKGIDLEEFRKERAIKEESRRRSLESFLEQFVEGVWKHKLEIRLVKLKSEEFDETFEESFAVYKKYQTSIHDDDDLTPDGFSRFLASSPLFSVKEAVHCKPTLGSYHQQYVLDGKIIAVGVIDILPRCMSSKYFFYDPDWKFLSLGTYSALREIAFTKSLCITRPELYYYYMGYYLFDCPKMRYKGKFRPSDLLCDKTLQWVPLSECVKMLEANQGKFTVFNQSQPSLKSESVNVDEIKCLVNDTVVPFSYFRTIVNNPDSLIEKVSAYAEYAGPVAKEMVLCI